MIICLGDGIFVGIEWFFDFVNNPSIPGFFFKIFKELNIRPLFNNNHIRFLLEENGVTNSWWSFIRGS
jgi:hypothetical protein